LFSADARCILEHSAEEHVLRSRTRCTLAPPVGKNLGQHAANIYSTGGMTYSAPKYYASVGDALSYILMLQISDPGLLVAGTEDARSCARSPNGRIRSLLGMT
jgi:hypothetical protein